MHTKVAIFILLVGLVGIVGWKYLEPHLTESSQSEITDAADFKKQISIAVDGWVGYFPLCSPELKKRLRREGYGLQCIDDSADYSERFKKLDRSEIDFAVATVDSYVLNAQQQGYPGAIVAVLDESKGGDAIVARKSAVNSLDQLKSGDSATLKVAFTAGSPSHHLLKSVASHFDVELFRQKSAQLHTDGSAAALSALKNDKADIAVLWEPDVSKALQSDEFVRLLGTEDTFQLIVDILVASRKVLQQEPEVILALLNNYFKTLKYYRDNPDVLRKEVAKYSNVDKSAVDSLLTGVKWQNLNSNAETWFSVAGGKISQQALVSTIESVVDVLLDNQDFSTHPLPNRDPFRLLNSSYIAQLFESFGKGAWNKQGASAETLTFAPLSDSQWNRLEAVGALKTRKITFASGTAELTELGAAEVDNYIKDLKHYPAFRIEVRGHTGTRGDPAVNLALSEERARTVLNYILSTHGLQPNRLRATGFGGTKPLAKKAGETSRAWRYRLPRVELMLVREAI